MIKQLFKLISILCFTLVLSGIFSSKVFASTIFQDDFNSGNDNQWTRISAPDSWYLENGQYGAISDNIQAISIANTNSLPEDYVFEFDTIGLSGVDRTLDLRWSNGAPTYAIHFNGESNPLTKNAAVQPVGWPIPTYFELQNNVTYHFKVVLNKSRIIFYINGNEIIDTVDSDYAQVPNERFGLRVPTGGSGGVDNVRFDNVIVRDIEPGDIPGGDLNVPLLKQTSSPWGTDTYDGANFWNPLHPTIASWGCALTSADMILKYYGYNLLPDGTPLNPGTLNSWLKSQPDGYVDDVTSGYVNWLAIARLSKLAKSINGLSGFDALEYSRFSGANILQLTSDLNNGIPDILEEPGHFIVASGIEGSTFTINDPFYNRASLDTGYANTFLSLGEYKKSLTDLSYMMFVVPEGVNVSVKDSSGNTVVAESYIQQPFIDPINGESGGQPLNIVLVPKPASGSYKIELSSIMSQYYDLKTYFYDQDGNAQTFSSLGTSGLGSSDTYNINFDNQTSNNSSELKTVTLQSAIDDVNESNDLNLLKGAGGYIADLRNAQKSADSGNLVTAQNKLSQFVDHLNQHYGKTITDSAYQILLYDVNYIKDHL